LVVVVVPAVALVTVPVTTAAMFAGVVVTLALLAVAVVAVAMVAVVVLVVVVVLAGVVVSLAALAVAGVAEPLSVSVVLVAVPMLVGMVIRRPFRVVAVIVVIPVVAGGVVRIRLLADSRLWGRGDPAAARALRGGKRRARGGNGRSGWSEPARTVSRRWAPGRESWGRVIGAARRLRRLGWRRDGGADLACSGGRGRNRRLLAGHVEKSRRCQNEANRSQYGEQADYGCGYARKTTPHKVSHRRASA
jgi:hypothetical protein